MAVLFFVIIDDLCYQSFIISAASIYKDQAKEIK
jgi:hypothetical protein